MLKGKSFMGVLALVCSAKAIGIRTCGIFTLVRG